ncbi:MAG: calcium/sodium antiporter [Deltaproteobacteria bacterium]|nr:calcium/sodium antiporter [Deltaproteobacteria bacterium]
MTFLFLFALFVLGLFLMVYGADRLVEGGSAIAVHFRISPLVIGLTIVSFGTSFPEFAASLVGALHGKTDLAMGNVIGSNICNLGLVLGAAALTRPIRVRGSLIRKEIPFLLLISAITWWMARDHRIGRGEGLFFVVLFVLFVYYCIRTARQRGDALPPGLPPGKFISLPRSFGALTFGLLLLFFGADLTIRAAVSISGRMGISQAVIGLTVVALGTSLPELVTSVMALRKGEGDIGLGNVLGSNIFNLLFVLGVTATVHPIPSSPQFFRFDIPVMLAFTVLLIPFAGSRLQISRREGGLLLAAYCGYILYLGLHHIL